MGRCGKTLAVLLPVVIAYYAFRGDKFDPESIRGRRVLVTGTSSGIGEQVAYRYAELGAKLVITARRKDLLERVATKCKELGAESVHTVPADMALPADRKTVVAATEKHLGGLDVLILNHATLGHYPWKGSAENLIYLENMMTVNFISYVDLTSMLFGALKKSQGYIGVMSSVCGKFGGTYIGPYSASKHALQGFYSSLRQELRFQKTGVSVTFLVYGSVASERVIELSKDYSAFYDFHTYAGTTYDAADALVRGVSARVYEVYFPRSTIIFILLNRIFPGYIEDLFVHIYKHDLQCRAGFITKP